jgi:murein DD-endopeptidase MepM/ murein hydrolase activator NlpD
VRRWLLAAWTTLAGCVFAGPVTVGLDIGVPTPLTMGDATAALGDYSPRKDRDMFPIMAGIVRVNSGYGPRDAPRNKDGSVVKGASTWHKGFDVRGAEGTPIYAPFSGHLSTTFRACGGNEAALIDGDQMLRVAHLRVPAIPGYYQAGSIIGFVGQTGTCQNGPHLHMEWWRRRNNAWSVVDPMPFWLSMYEPIK